MQRALFKDLVKWKGNPERKPLVLEGARQVGKTWLLKEFGRHEYSNVVYINCDGNPQMQLLFSDYDTSRLLRGFSAISGEIIQPHSTLIILDEVQEVPEALTSLKYFAENAPDYHIAVAGSLLGLKMHADTGYPVGKTDSFKLYPLSFSEFLAACGKDVLLEMIREHDFANMNAFIPQLTDLLRQYYYTGGMPAVVDYYLRTQDLGGVRRLQKDIITDYERDFSKHTPPSVIPRIFAVWNSIPSQLAKENKKFIYGSIRKGARAKDYESAIIWLKKAGLIYTINCLKKLERPLKFYENSNSFKIFMVDLGLLGAMVDSRADEVLIGSKVFSDYKGSFTEQYVAQQFISTFGDSKLYYYTNDNSTLEIDFVSESDKVYPIEVKAETDLRSKRLSSVLNRNPDLKGIRFSMSPYIEQDRLTNVPLPLVEEYLRMVFD
ncbi:MAG: ATP-binding protein [Spirochaetes bacterium]|uniref:ATP-binding protein n=1 Tax=Candidatus Ornithospirochaeta stercoripullorum TaxID=2840899 RepID=A0A9D9E4Y4_9SPIO|nr:ATP-binding protein [Candidatus Ornithospirochaeta stercoripullorum]